MNPLYDGTITLHIRAANKVEARQAVAAIEEIILEHDLTPETIERVFVEWQIEEIEPGTPEIEDNMARFIAAGWADGGDMFQVFASTGATCQPETGPDYEYERFLQQIETMAGLEGLQFDGDFEAEALRNLKAYVKSVGPRGPVDGWGDMPETDRERESREVWEEQERGYNQIVTAGLR